MAGNYQQMVLLLKRRFPIHRPHLQLLLQLLSHKGLRLISPLLLLLMYVTNSVLLKISELSHSLRWPNLVFFSPPYWG